MTQRGIVSAHKWCETTGMRLNAVQKFSRMRECTLFKCINFSMQSVAITGNRLRTRFPVAVLTKKRQKIINLLIYNYNNCHIELA